MPSFYVFAAAAFFATNTAATIALPRGEALFFDETRLLFARDPQSDSFCDGITCSGDICVPSGYHCCSDGGAGCPVGSNCIPNGCCPIGETCTGGGGTITDPGTGPTLDFSSTPAGKTPPAATHASNTGGKSSPLETTSEDGYESFIATAYPSTGAAAAGGLGTTTGFPAVSVATATRALSSSLPSVTPVSGGSSSGGSSSGGSSSPKAASAAKPLSRSTVLSGIAVLAGLVAIQLL